MAEVEEGKVKLVGHIEIDLYSNGRMFVNKPDSIVLSYGMLEMAKDAIREEAKERLVEPVKFNMKGGGN